MVCMYAYIYFRLYVYFNEWRSNRVLYVCMYVCMYVQRYECMYNVNMILEQQMDTL